MPSADLSSFLDFARELREDVDAALARKVNGYLQYCPATLREAMQYSLLSPGKRLRPMLVFLATEACNPERINAAWPAACAVEMVHTYSLIHDDLPAMDDDDIRRGQPSCHVKFDEATAILAGDALLSLAFEVLAREVQPPATAVQCSLALASVSGAISMVGGQIDDLAAERGEGTDPRKTENPENIDQLLEHLTSIHRRKTGAMLRVSLRLGALVAGVGVDDNLDQSDSRLVDLDMYGSRLGLAFQIVDDLLDAKGDAAQLGKSTRQDAKRGKLTFPSLLGVEESRKRAAELVEEACEVVAPFGPGAVRLQELAQYVLTRDH